MFQMPETLDGLSIAEVTALLEAAQAAALELNAIPDDTITKDQSAELIELVGHLGTLDDTLTELQAADATVEQLTAARAALAGREVAAEEAGERASEDAPAEENADAEVQEKELILASGAPAGRTSTFASKMADKAAADGVHEAERDTNRILAQLDEAKQNALTITAAANVPDFNSNQRIDSFLELAKAYGNRAEAFASGLPGSRNGRKSLDNVSYRGHALSNKAQRYGVARLAKPQSEFVIHEKTSAQDAYALIMRAASEKRLGGNSLIAAGGWCSPSEIMYGFLELETAEGLLNIAELQAPRGGIQFTKGPQLGPLLTDATLGWVMTEAEAEAGTFTKPIFDIDCPDWEEVRMDAVGYALRAGLLTDTTFPEVLRRYLALALIVHARRMNKLTIDRISTMIGAATAFTPVGAQPSATADLLSAIELNAMRIREQYSMGLRSTVEAIFPLWVKMVVRSDLSRRLGVDSMLSVTDQQIEAWFKARQIAPQFVRDYQPINNGALSVAGGTAGWTAVPNKVEFMMFPAGAFVRLATAVINLDTVYDTDNLTKNEFLAAFFEEGFGIANTGASGVKVSVSLPNVFGSVGYPSIGALANVAPTP